MLIVNAFYLKSRLNTCCNFICTCLVWTVEHIYRLYATLKNFSSLPISGQKHKHTHTNTFTSLPYTHSKDWYFRFPEWMCLGALACDPLVASMTAVWCNNAWLMDAETCVYVWMKRCGKWVNGAGALGLGTRLPSRLVCPVGRGGRTV